VLEAPPARTARGASLVKGDDCLALAFVQLIQLG
jgi:hypothetical protein